MVFSLISLKQIDIIVLKKLVEVANVVPVIAKSDSLTPEERIEFKRRVNHKYIHRTTDKFLISWY